MKTKEQIKDAIEKLEAVKPSVRRYSAFGDDNWAKIDAQIIVLEMRMSEDDIYDRYEDEYELVNDALLAYQWMMDEPIEDLDEEIETVADIWKGLTS